MAINNASQEKGQIEEQFRQSGKIVVGVDEVGRGCLAGPVVASCVMLDFDMLARLDNKSKDLIRDSKTLSAKQRHAQVQVIHEISLSRVVAGTEAAE